MTEILLLGDLILDAPDPDHWLGGIAPFMHAADVAIGHLEVPYTAVQDEMGGDIPAPGADPSHIAALARAGLTAVSLAGNHMMDCGPAGLAETLLCLERAGIRHAGAGPNLGEARRPALIERQRRTIALLSYNCVGPEFSWATPNQPGCAYVAVRPADGGPARPQADLSTLDPESVEHMRSDIRRARRDAELVIVALHKGITHRPAQLAPYERPLSYAAVEAGADVVVGHHAHIARGIEFHRGAPIYHGLGNGVVVTNALSPAQDNAARADWVERRKRLFGFEPDPAYPLAPFHPDAVNGMIAHLRWSSDGSIDAGLIPIWFEPPGRPVYEELKAGGIAEYIAKIGADAGLPPVDVRRTNGTKSYSVTPRQNPAID